MSDSFRRSLMMKARSRTAITIKTTKSRSRSKPVRSFPRMNRTITDMTRKAPAAAISGTRAFSGEMLRRHNHGPPKPVIANTATKTKTGYHATTHLYSESAQLTHTGCGVDTTGSSGTPCSPDQWDYSWVYSFRMHPDDFRPVRPFRTPWTVGRMAADTCVWLDLFDPSRPEHAAMESLLGYRREARVEILKTDTVDTERTQGVPDATAIERVLETAGIVEIHGPAVWDHSRWDHSVWAGDEDGERIDEVFAALFPGSDRHGTDRTSRHKIRDAMHVATAVRYGCDAFVTTDGDLLRKAAQIQALRGIEILSPSDAVRWVQRRIERERIRSKRRRKYETEPPVDEGSRSNESVRRGGNGRP